MEDFIKEKISKPAWSDELQNSVEKKIKKVECWKELTKSYYYMQNLDLSLQKGILYIDFKKNEFSNNANLFHFMARKYNLSYVNFISYHTLYMRQTTSNLEYFQEKKIFEETKKIIAKYLKLARNKSMWRKTKEGYILTIPKKYIPELNSGILDIISIFFEETEKNYVIFKNEIP